MFCYLVVSQEVRVGVTKSPDLFFIISSDSPSITSAPWGPPVGDVPFLPHAGAGPLGASLFSFDTSRPHCCLLPGEAPQVEVRSPLHGRQLPVQGPGRRQTCPSPASLGTRLRVSWQQPLCPLFTCTPASWGPGEPAGLAGGYASWGAFSPRGSMAPLSAPWAVPAQCLLLSLLQPGPRTPASPRVPGVAVCSCTPAGRGRAAEGDIRPPSASTNTRPSISAENSRLQTRNG